jgi:hypothetical protein
MLITQEVKNGISRIRLHLDPERDEQSLSRSGLPKVTTLRGVAGQKPVTEKGEMHWTSADTLEIEIPLRGNETALSVLEAPTLPRVTLAPVTLPYSPEFAPVSGEEGIAALARLAQATGGKQRIELSGVWKDLPRQPRLIEMAPWLLMLAIFSLLVEVLERHTGLISTRLIPTLRAERIAVPDRLRWLRKTTVARTSEATPVEHHDQQAIPNEIEPPAPAATPEANSEASPTVIMEALRQARRQARERTKR